jgi:hypothetical protein
VGKPDSPPITIAAVETREDSHVTEGWGLGTEALFRVEPYVGPGEVAMGSMAASGESKSRPSPGLGKCTFGPWQARLLPTGTPVWSETPTTARDHCAIPRRKNHCQQANKMTRLVSYIVFSSVAHQLWSSLTSNHNVVASSVGARGCPNRTGRTYAPPPEPTIVATSDAISRNYATRIWNPVPERRCCLGSWRIAPTLLRTGTVVPLADSFFSFCFAPASPELARRRIWSAHPPPQTPDLRLGRRRHEAERRTEAG